MAGSARAASAVKGPRTSCGCMTRRNSPARPVPSGVRNWPRKVTRAAVVVGGLLGQPGEAFGLRHGRGEHRAPAVGGGGVVLPVGLEVFSVKLPPSTQWSKPAAKVRSGLYRGRWSMARSRAVCSGTGPPWPTPAGTASRSMTALATRIGAPA